MSGFFNKVGLTQIKLNNLLKNKRLKAVTLNNTILLMKIFNEDKNAVINTRIIAILFF